MKLLVVALLLALAATRAYSQTMVIQMKNGAKVQYRINEIDKITYSMEDELKGMWSGSYAAYNDPAGARNDIPTLRIDFDAMNAWSSHCNYEKSAGRVKILPHSKIQIDWPGCGTETVDFSVCGGTLTAAGSEKAFSNGRAIRTGWRLSKE